MMIRHFMPPSRGARCALSAPIMQMVSRAPGCSRSAGFSSTRDERRVEIGAAVHRWLDDDSPASFAGGGL
jgi:hypothetical protein